MSVKTERITILASSEFKTFLHGEASKEGVSVSELIRGRCINPSSNSEDETILMALIDQVKESTAKARSSLDKGLKDATKALKELRKERKVI